MEGAEPMRLCRGASGGKGHVRDERQRLRLHQSPQFRELGGIHAAPRETFHLVICNTSTTTVPPILQM